jgi:hypothetical protein
MEKERMMLSNETDTASAYSYLLEWQWPEHIESLLRRLLFLSFAELAGDAEEQTIADSDALAAKAMWLISVYPKTSPSILHSLAQQQPARYAERIAENPNSLPETLELLAKHPSENVRAAVAENGNTPAHVLMQLLEDESLDVRYAMAENPNLPELVLQMLEEDDNCYVASRARRTLTRVAPPSAAPMPFRKPQQQQDELANRRTARG